MAILVALQGPDRWLVLIINQVDQWVPQVLSTLGCKSTAVCKLFFFPVISFFYNLSQEMHSATNMDLILPSYYIKRKNSRIQTVNNTVVRNQQQVPRTLCSRWWVLHGPIHMGPGPPWSPIRDQANGWSRSLIR